ncbi:diacylglycerol/lipid kinase family protein [Streptococcus sp. DD13]|uniref:diacylglycerol/lipid kinase family protein n=1 Tax=Streptococcus sp. DD13 TaxID=1777881 RepID=UPI0007911182|nr:diacylglycerol kinase family protein [Streptococcus sp. DD13]KXT77777.1 Transcription regulator [Streptococcus sp. DD13]
MLFILGNPNAGDKRSQQKINEIKETYPQLEIKVFLTSAKDQEKEVVQAILEQYQDELDQLLIIGGDGTLSKVLRYWPAQFPFAYLPSGTGNDFEKGYSLPQISDLMRAIEHQSTAEITVLHSEDWVVVNSLGAGFDARVIEQSDKMTVLKKFLNQLHIGWLLYPILGIFSMFSRKTVSLTLTDEKGQEYQYKHLFLFVLANNRFFGGGILIWPDSSITKSQIDMVYSPYKSIFRNILCLLQLLFHRQATSRIIHHQVFHTLKITFPDEEGVQIDGEFVKIKEIQLKPQLRKIYR